jgi:hypothetical protein
LSARCVADGLSASQICPVNSSGNGVGTSACVRIYLFVCCLLDNAASDKSRGLMKNELEKTWTEGILT